MNAVAFGFIETRMTEASDEKKSLNIEGRSVPVGIPTKVVEGVKATIPLGRGGTAEEAANGVYLLCSPESDYITGQLLVVDGGMTM